MDATGSAKTMIDQDVLPTVLLPRARRLPVAARAVRLVDRGYMDRSDFGASPSGTRMIETDDRCNGKAIFWLG